MISRSILAAAGIAAAALTAATAVLAPARAQGNVEAELLGFHQLCDKGGRRACVRFGILIGQNQQRHAAGGAPTPTGFGGKSNFRHARPPSWRPLSFRRLPAVIPPGLNPIRIFQMQPATAVL
jgi:hypothetical protein